MESEMKASEMTELLHAVRSGVERLQAAAAAMGSSAQNRAAGEVEKITAAVDPSSYMAAGDSASCAATGALTEDRGIYIEQRLLQIEQALVALQAGAAGQGLQAAEQRVAARKTLPAATVQLLAKQGIDLADPTRGLNAGDVQSVDAALAGLSVEQRIAVKSQLLRTGALTV
jgi:hypothetical protein